MSLEKMNTEQLQKSCNTENITELGEKNEIINKTINKTEKLKCDISRAMNDDLSFLEKLEYKKVYDNFKEKLDSLSHFQKQMFQGILGVKMDGTLGENSKKAFLKSNFLKVENGEIVLPELPTKKEANDIGREANFISKDDMQIFQKHLGLLGKNNVDGFFGRNTLINYISKYPNWKTKNIKNIVDKVKKDIKTIENPENKFNEFKEKSKGLSEYQRQVFQEILGVEPDGIFGKNTYNIFTKSLLFNIKNGEIIFPILPTRTEAHKIQKQVDQMNKSDRKLVQKFIGTKPDGVFGRKSFIAYIKKIPNWNDLNSLEDTLQTITLEPERQIERNIFSVENFYKNVDRVSSGFLERYLKRLTGEQIDKLNRGKQKQLANILNEKLSEVYVPIDSLKSFVISEVFNNYHERNKYGKLLKSFLHRLYRMGIEPEIFFTKIFIHESGGNQKGARQFAASGTGSLGLGQATSHSYLNFKQNNVFNPLNDRQAVSGAIKHFIMEAYRYVHKSKMPVEYLITYCLDIYNKGLNGSKKIVDNENKGVKNEYDRSLAYMMNPYEMRLANHGNHYNYAYKVMNGTNRYVPWNKSNPYYNGLNGKI